MSQLCGVILFYSFFFFPSFGSSGQEERTRWARWLSSSNPGRARGTWLWTTTQRNSFKVTENGRRGAKHQFLVSSGLHRLRGLLGVRLLQFQPRLENLHLLVLVPPSPASPGGPPPSHASISSLIWRSSVSSLAWRSSIFWFLQPHLEVLQLLVPPSSTSPGAPQPPCTSIFILT